MYYSTYYDEIKEIVRGMGHEEPFVSSTCEAIDTLFLNFLNGYKRDPYNSKLIKQIAAAQVQQFYNDFIMYNVKCGASEKWGKTVISTAFMCLNDIAKYDDSIKILFSVFQYLVLNIEPEDQY